MRKSITLRIKSTITDLMLADKYQESCVNGSFRADDGEVYPEDRIKELCDDVTSYSVSGELTFEDGKYTVSYDEAENIGFDGCKTALYFEESDRNTVTLVRSGEVSMACRFDMKEKRQRCYYDTPIMPVEFNIVTRSVHNTVSEDGGAVLLDYFIEVRGSNTERNRIFIEIEPAYGHD